MLGIFREFRDFIARGNVVDLAVGVIAGIAFGAVVTSLVQDVITPLIAAVGGEPDFSSWKIHVDEGRIAIGKFLNTVISFLLTMAAVFFLIVKPLSVANARFIESEPGEPIERDCPHCLSQIPAKATRCAYCCADSAPAA
jgi:large conductance mechanosensitive channel